MSYDVLRSPVRVLTAVRDGSAPLPVAYGLVDAVEGMTEALCRLSCQGRDAFLEPVIVPGVVTYLPGDDPLLTTAPVPENPCGSDAEPTVTPGTAPPEPDPLPDPEPGPEPAEPTEPAPEDGEVPTASRVVYAVHDVNSDGRNPAEESDDPEGENVINLADRPLNGSDEDNGLDTQIIHVYRSGVVTTWLPNTAYIIGQRVRRAADDPFVWECIDAGTSGAVEPAWDADEGDTTVDNGVEWRALGDCGPIVGAVPGTHLRIHLGVSLSPTFSGGPPFVDVSKVPNALGSFAAGAPADLDDALDPSFTDEESGTPLAHITAGGSYELELEIGDATHIMVLSNAGSNETADVSVSRVQFYTPDE